MDYYYFPVSHWSRVVSLALAEKNLRPTRHVVDIRCNANFHPDYVRLNPRAVVPTLIDGGEPICDGPTIVSHLDGIVGPVLRSPETAALARRLEDLPIMLFSYSFWVQGTRNEHSREILDDKIERATRHAEEHPDLREQYRRKKEFFEAFRRDVYDDDHVRQEEDKARVLLSEVAEVVERSDYIGGKQFSYADCIAIPALYRLADIQKADIWRGDRDHPLVRYFDRVRARPAYSQVFVDDPLIPPGSQGDGGLAGFGS